MTPEKLRIIAVARKQLALADDDYRSILRLYGGVESARDLAPGGFTAVMRRFDQLGFKSTSKRKPMAQRMGMAAPGQVSLMRQLWAEFTDGQGTDATLGKWLERQFRASALAFVSADLAPKVVAGMKAMVAKRAASAAPHDAA